MNDSLTPTALESLELFYGPLSQVEARVFARLACAVDPGLELTGFIQGPSCALAQTLPAKIFFRPRQAGDHLLVEALLPDPCCWSPDLPFLYHATLQLARNGEVVAEARRPLGLRPLTVVETNLFYESRRWVLRCLERNVCGSHDAPSAVGHWHGAAAAMCVDHVDDELAEAASVRGVLIAERLGAADRHAVIQRLTHLARWPAVAIVAITARDELPADIGRCAPNLLLAWRPTGASDEAAPQWARACWVPENWISQGTFPPRVGLPVLVERTGKRFDSIPDARAECDRLQRDLAPFGDFAGYIIST